MGTVSLAAHLKVCWLPATLAFALPSRAVSTVPSRHANSCTPGSFQKLASKRVVSSNKREREDVVGFSLSAERVSVAAERMTEFRRVKPPAQRCSALQTGSRPDVETEQGGQAGWTRRSPRPG